LPPLPPFRVDREILPADEFEEELSYFDLPGGTPTNFEKIVDEKIASYRTQK
jgi:hypothetical protein